MYRSEATIIIKDPSNTQSTIQLGTYSNLINHVSMSNEILQLQSRELMKDVVRALDADIDYIAKDRLREVELYRDSPVRMFIFREEADEAGFELRVTPSDESALEMVSREGKSRVELGDTVNVSGYNLVFKPSPTYNGYLGKSVTIRKRPVSDVASSLVSRLNVLQVEEDGSILQLSIVDYSHARADDLLNMLVTKYNEDAVREKNRIAVNTAAFINERLAIIQDELGGVEESLAQLKSSERIIDVEQTASEYLSENKEINASIIEIDTKINSARFLKDYVESSFEAFETIPVNMSLDDQYVVESI